MISFKQKGDFSKLTRYFERVKQAGHIGFLDKYGKRGVQALASATPQDTGRLASSWYYKIENNGKTVRLNFCNSDIENGAPVAIVLQYGHGTQNGGWVEGKDYINPAVQPIFDEIVKEAWKEVTKL